MMDADIIRVVNDLKTFTAIDLANALEWPEGTAGARLSEWCKTGYVVRVKINRTFLYAVSPKSARIYAKLPPIDPDERCLPLSFHGLYGECPSCGCVDVVITQTLKNGAQYGECPSCLERLWRHESVFWTIDDIPF